MRVYTRPVFIALFLILCSTSPAFADDDVSSRESLKGLPGVFVIVQDLEPAIEQAGLTKADIQMDVELRLRLAGIPVLSRAEWITTPGGPYLYVNTNVFNSNNTVWPFSVEISSMQRVILERGSANIFFAPTWSVTTVGSVGSNKLTQVKDVVKEYVDQFINAYLAVNPKK